MCMLPKVPQSVSIYVSRYEVEYPYTTAPRLKTRLWEFEQGTALPGMYLCNTAPIRSENIRM